MSDPSQDWGTFSDALKIGLQALKSAQTTYGENRKAHIELAEAAARLAQAAK